MKIRPIGPMNLGRTRMAQIYPCSSVGRTHYLGCLGTNISCFGQPGPGPNHTNNRFLKINLIILYFKMNVLYYNSLINLNKILK